MYDDVVSRDDYSKLLATHGARSLLNAGPLYDIRRLIYGQIGYIRDDILYVGIICGSDFTDFSFHGECDEMNIIIAWCSPAAVLDDIQSLRSTRNEQGSVIWDYYDYFPYLHGRCNVTWTGKLEKPMEG